MSFLRLGANGPLLKLASGGWISTTSNPVQQNVPSVVSSLAAGSISPTGLTLTWTASSGTSPITYAVYQKLHSGTDYVNVGSTQSTTFPITGLTAATQYDFYLTAANTAGTSVQGNVISPTTLTQINVAPGIVNTLQSGVQSSTTVSLTWQAPSTGTTPFTYQPQYKLHSDTSYTNFGSGISGTSVTVTNLTPDTSYDFRINVSNGTSPNSTGTAIQQRTGIAPGQAPGTLVDLTWTQPAAIHPKSNGVNKRIRVGWFDPVGGIGPFVWNLTDRAGGKYSHDVNPFSRGEISIDFQTVGTVTDSITMSCTDARGVTVTKTVQINKTNGSTDVAFMNFRNPNHNCTVDNFYHGPYFTPNVVGDTWENAGYNVNGPAAGGYLTNTATGQASTLWLPQYDIVMASSTVIPAGTYPVRANVTNTGTNQVVPVDFTINIVNFTPISYIETSPLPSLSTTSTPGQLLGRARATTPNNHPSWAIHDTNGYLSIDSARGDITLAATPSTPTTISFQITVTDDTAVFTQSFQIPVVQGTTLPGSNMTMSVVQNLKNTNADPGNSPPLAIGTPSITGMPAGQLTWSITGTQRYNFQMDNPGGDARNGVGYKRFECNPTTGAVTSRAYLSATTGTAGEWFDLTAVSADGATVCTQRFYVPVAAATGPVFHVGQGMATGHPTGTTGYEYLRDFLYNTPNLNNWSGDLGAIAGFTCYIHWNSDPNYYADDVVQQINYNVGRSGLNGPGNFVGVVGPQGQFPRLGAPVGSPRGWYQDKGFFILNHGDFKFQNLELSFSTMDLFAGDYLPASNYQMSLIRQDSGKSGDIWIDNCDIHDADVPVHTGNTDGVMKITNSRFYNGAGCTSGGQAPQHNLYLGTHWNLIMDNVLSFNCADGHVFKCRAQNGTITNCRFYDGERGSQFNALDLPQGGNYVIDNCVFQKGAMPQNPWLLQFNEELDESTDLYFHKQLVIRNSTFINQGPPTLSSGAVAYRTSINGRTNYVSNVTLENCSFAGISTPEQVSQEFQGNLPGEITGYLITNTNPTYLPGFPALDFTTPCTYDCGRPSWHLSLADLNRNNDWPYFNARQIDPGVDQIRIPANASIGTVVFTPTAYGCANWDLSWKDIPGNDGTRPPGYFEPNVNPWNTGATWSFGNKPLDYTGNSHHWVNDAHPGRYAINPTTGQVTVAGALGGIGNDNILIRATARTDSALGTASGKIVENAFSIVKF